MVGKKVKKKGIDLLKEAKFSSGLPIVTEIMDARLLDEVSEVADVFKLEPEISKLYIIR